MIKLSWQWHNIRVRDLKMILSSFELGAYELYNSPFEEE